MTILPREMGGPCRQMKLRRIVIETAIVLAAVSIVVLARFILISIGGPDNCGFDDDSVPFRSGARTVAVLKTIQRHFDSRLGQLRLRQRFSAISIGG